MEDIHFTKDQFSEGMITVPLTHEFYMKTLKHESEKGGYIQQVNVISPSGQSKVFDFYGWHYSGLYYKNGDITLNLIEE